jgi:hypothetical protein
MLRKDSWPAWKRQSRRWAVVRRGERLVSTESRAERLRRELGEGKRARTPAADLSQCPRSAA